MNRRITRALGGCCGGALLAAASVAQTPAAPPPAEPAPHVVYVVPQWRPATPQPGATLTSVHATVSIDDRVAVTRLAMTMTNPSATAQEAQLLIPVPSSAAIQSFGYGDGNKEFTARLLTVDEARATYESIVRTMRDPGLLEFLDDGLIRSSVFPIPAHGSVEAWVSYVHPLGANGSRLDYVLPRSSSLDQSSVKWTADIRVRSTIPIVSAYSPTHEIKVTRIGEREVAIGLAGDNVAPGPLRLSILRNSEPMAASLIAYPDPANSDSGYFMLLLGVTDDTAAHPDQTIPRQVTLVLDRSGSMAGPKFEQARAAALQVVEGLDPGERFNIIDYNDVVASFSKEPVAKTDQTIADARAYLQALTHGGGTNIHDALLQAVGAPDANNALPVILFLTDGRPTVGVTGEAEIRRAVQHANIQQQRIFTFGVGTDVNAPLLDAIAGSSRASTAYVLPGEDIEVALSDVFARLRGPTLTDPMLTPLDAANAEDIRRIRDVLPATLPDIFAGDQLVILGRYSGSEPLRFRLSATTADAQITALFTFGVDDASPANGYVARLWASRRIASLIDAIRMAGADNPDAPHPEQKEMIDEIVRLSLQFGILTEYTAFLATEQTATVADGRVNLNSSDVVVTAFAECLDSRAVQTRSGAGAVNQSKNLAYQCNQSTLNATNSFYAADLSRTQTLTVQQLNRDALFCYNDAWVDGALLGAAFQARGQGEQSKAEITPDNEIEFGSPEYFQLADRLNRDGRADLLAQRGDVYLSIDGKTTRINSAIP